MSETLTLELHNNSKFVLRGDGWEAASFPEFARLPDGPYWLKVEIGDGDTAYLSCLRNSYGLSFDGEYEMRQQ